MSDKGMHEKHKCLDIVDAVYKKGYDDGYYDGKEADQSDNADHYKQGLNEAWECARWIATHFMECGKVFSIKEWAFDLILTNYSAQEAIERVKNYEAEQKQKEEEEKTPFQFHIGDEVISNKGVKGFIVSINDRSLSYISDKGMGFGRVEYFTKTNNHCDAVEDLVKTIKGVLND